MALGIVPDIEGDKQGLCGATARQTYSIFFFFLMHIIAFFPQARRRFWGQFRTDREALGGWKRTGRAEQKKAWTLESCLEVHQNQGPCQHFHLCLPEHTPVPRTSEFLYVKRCMCVADCVLWLVCLDQNVRFQKLLLLLLIYLLFLWGIHVLKIHDVKYYVS